LNPTTRGALAGMAVAVVSLLFVAVGLLHADGGGPFVMIAVWLWILPALAVFGLAGSLVAKGLVRKGLIGR
jgi:hypothetical protein